MMKHWSLFLYYLTFKSRKTTTWLLTCFPDVHFEYTSRWCKWSWCLITLKTSNMATNLFARVFILSNLHDDLNQLHSKLTEAWLLNFCCPNFILRNLPDDFNCLNFRYKTVWLLTVFVRSSFWVAFPMIELILMLH